MRWNNLPKLYNYVRNHFENYNYDVTKHLEFYLDFT